MREELLSNKQTGFEDIRENYARIRENMQNAMAQAGRSDKVRLMAVTKTVSPDRINCAVGLGIDLLGENRVQEFLDKRESYSPAEIHFIGSLQTNKVKYIIDKVSMIHSVDSLRLAEEINRRAGQHGLVMDILAEVNIGGEESKSGVSPRELRDFCGQLGTLENVRLRGLMTIPPPGCGEDRFAEMQGLFAEIKSGAGDSSAHFDTLSMGMSGDYEAAIKYGATIIRIGSGLFGYRKYL
ncbi:MAG: YggS family pyridoxal phosphate-dependent enzyme [Oscillospiraceae bacterium]|nr:YggS family pyridoxal phosphate-dependent enzyme [Oscillospiraceae bacterium]